MNDRDDPERYGHYVKPRPRCGDCESTGWFGSCPHTEPEPPPPSCLNCNDTGDVHRVDGEWLGRCTCDAGTTVSAEGMPASNEPNEAEVQRIPPSNEQGQP